VKNRKPLGVVLLLYGLACALPAYYSHPGEPVYGIVCLMLMLFVFLLPTLLVMPYWWANLIFFAGCVALAKGRAEPAMVLGIVATACAASFFPLYNPRDGIGIGYAFWVAAMACLAICGYRARRSESDAGTRSGSTCGEVRRS
jgi:hypothetical protein